MKKYDWNAQDYKNHSHAQLQWARELIGKLHLKGDENILDVGCGDGKISAEIAGRVPYGTVIGVDNSTSMLKLAQSLFSAEQYPNLSFALMDAATLSFNGKFDIVFSNAALHWLKNHQPVLKGIYNALKPGGRILLQMGGKGNARLMVFHSNSVMQREKWREYFIDDLATVYLDHVPPDESGKAHIAMVRLEVAAGKDA